MDTKVGEEWLDDAGFPLARRQAISDMLQPLTQGEGHWELAISVQKRSLQN